MYFEKPASCLLERMLILLSVTRAPLAADTVTIYALLGSMTLCGMLVSEEEQTQSVVQESLEKAAVEKFLYELVQCKTASKLASD